MPIFVVEFLHYHDIKKNYSLTEGQKHGAPSSN